MADNPWDAFGDDDDDDEDDCGVLETVNTVIRYLLQVYGSRLVSDLLVWVMDDDDDDDTTATTDLADRLTQRGLQVVMDKNHAEQRVDAVITRRTSIPIHPSLYESLPVGGLLFLVERRNASTSCSDDDDDDDDASSLQWHLLLSNHHRLKVWQKCPRIQVETCRWLDATHHNKLNQEVERLLLATVVVVDSVSQRRQQQSTWDIRTLQRAANQLLDAGYCVVPQLLDPTTCQQYGTAAVADLNAAADILKHRDNVHLYHPGQGSPVGVYRELSQREELRFDIREGPHLRQLEGHDQNRLLSACDDFFRGNPVLQQIVTLCMNRSDETLAPYNYGRYNFQTNAQPGDAAAAVVAMHASRIGAIVTLPGAADQALHADTPHLWDCLPHLPPHYINAFTPTVKSQPGMGQTAFLAQSHRLDMAAQLLSLDNKSDMYQRALVRPQLEPGDVVLFDCRILHFGLANESTQVRPVLYTNMTLHWFQDPKNWDNESPIFGDENGVTETDDEKIEVNPRSPEGAE